MNRISQRLYMREHSNVIRKFQSAKLLDKMEENPIFNIDGTNRLIIVTICRIRQRILTQAWRVLTRNTEVKHDYEVDARVILSRKLPEEELRTELEIEILFKWIYQTKDIDPTGIANTIFLCKKRSAIYNALQQIRLEFYEPGETVLFQSDIPRPEDGHFTILSGNCEVLQFPDESMPLMKLLYFAKKKKWEDAKKLLNQAIVLARIGKASGFGELSTLTGVKRAATIRTDPNATSPTEIVVLPKQALLDCLKSRRQDGVEGAAPSEAMDFMRQSGLANRISPKDLVRVAQSMIRRTLLQGEILYYKNETVKSLFLVVSGELLLDTGEFMTDGKPQPFLNSNPDNCFHMSSGSILGDEGVTGQSNRFESTAVVVSDAAVVFEAVGFGMTFLIEKIGALRYCALTYRDKSRWSAPIHMAEEINPYTYFHSLRKAIAYTHPYRGSRPKIYDEYVEDKNIKKNPVVPRGGHNHSSKRKTGGLENSRGSAKHHRASSSSGNLAAPPPRMMRMDSNLAYMMNADRDANPTPDVEFQLPRHLKPVGLHHALDINRIAKKLAHKFVKVHAQENILYDQMTKVLSATAPGPEAEEAEKKFKSYILEYRDRAAKNAAKVQKEMERERLSKAYTVSSAAVKFYGSLSPDNSVSGNSQFSRGRSVGPQEDALAGMVSQSRPFTTPSKDHDKDGGDKQDKQGGSPQLNVSEIEKALAHALQVDDEAAQLAAANVTQTQTQTATQESYEDEFFHLRPKIVQYFIWMDHLNRHTYRSLLQQSQQTIDHSLHRSHEKLVVTDKTMDELNHIFNRFGLTPTDMNIPWRPGSPKAIAGKGNFDEVNSDDEEEAALTTPALTTPGVSSPPQTPHVPALDLPVQIPTLEDVKKNVVVNGTTADEVAARMAANKLAGKFKTYNPSSWRHEIIMKKEKGITKENFHLFARSPTPDNRRICWKHYHYPGHHHPDFFKDVAHQHMHPGDHNHHHRTLSGRLSGKLGPPNTNSRPSTGHHHSHHEDESDTESQVEQKALAMQEEREYLEDLQAHFADDPEKFMEAVKAVDLTIRRQHLPNKGWKTRFIRTTNDEAKPLARKKQNLLEPLSPKAAVSDAYSKQRLLDNAKAIQANNSQMYILTDSAKMIEASMANLKGYGSVTLQSMNMVMKGRHTTHSHSAAHLPLQHRDSVQSFGDSVASASAASAGELSGVDSMSREEEHAHTGKFTEPHLDVQEEEALSDLDGEEEAAAEGDAFDEQGGSVAPGAQSPPHGNSVGTGTIDEQSIGGSTIAMLNPSQLSPVAPAPSHIDQSTLSGENLEAHLQSALSLSISPLAMPDSAVHAHAGPAGVGFSSIDVGSSSLVGTHTLESSQTASDLHLGSPAGTTPNALKHSDTASQRVKEIRDRINARAPSAALEEFQAYMSTDNNPRKFYVGKKKASANSKYSLAHALRGDPIDAWKPSERETELFGAAKPSLDSDAALFNSLFPNSTEEQRRQYIERSRRARMGGPTDAELKHSEATSLAESNSKMSVKDLKIDTIVKSRRDSFGARSTPTALSKSTKGAAPMVSAAGRIPTAEECEEDDLDPDVVLWQHFTIDLMHKEKTGPKKILPVLIMKNEGGASSRRFAVNKSKRWGSGVLLQLASEAEEAAIDGPSTYLEIFKGNQRRPLREHVRKRITDELHAIVK